MTSVVRLGALALGMVCSCLGMYGAFEFALKLEGNAVTYIVLAAPVIAGAAAIIPVFAEATWRERAYLKALLWWAALVPAGAVVFFSAAERVHVAKAGAQAERSRSSECRVSCPGCTHQGRSDLAQARADANKARAQKQCGPDCRSKLAAEAAAQADVDAARRELLAAEKQGHDGQPSSGSRVATPCGARHGRLHGDLDSLLRRSLQAGNGAEPDSEGHAAQGEAHSTSGTQGGRCPSESRGVLPARGQQR